MTQKRSHQIYFAGALILFSALGTFRNAIADNIRLSTGEILSVTILETTDTTIRFHHPVLGEITLPRKAVEIVTNTEAAPAPAATANPAPSQTTATADTAATSVDQEIVSNPTPPPPQREWKFKWTLATAATSGNSDTANLATKFTANRETLQTRTAFDAAYFVATSSAVRTDNKFTAGLQQEWLVPDSPWFYFVDGRYDFDEFQSWDQRASAHVGMGYELFNPPPFKLNALAGVGAIKEFGSANEDVRPEALLKLEGEWAIAEKQTLKFDSTMFPSLSELGEFRWVNNAAWSLLIDTENRVSLTAGLAHEYQSQVNPGRTRNDLRVFAGIDWEF